jgi:flagellar biogenesis protein FliO
MGGTFAAESMKTSRLGKERLVEHALVHMAATAVWFFVIVFIFAVIGVFATIAWIVGLFRRGEAAVESGVQSIERRL